MFSCVLSPFSISLRSGCRVEVYVSFRARSYQPAEQNRLDGSPARLTVRLLSFHMAIRILALSV